MKSGKKLREYIDAGLYDWGLGVGRGKQKGRLI